MSESEAFNDEGREEDDYERLIVVAAHMPLRLLGCLVRRLFPAEVVVVLDDLSLERQPTHLDLLLHSMAQLEARSSVPDRHAHLPDPGPYPSLRSMKFDQRLRRGHQHGFRRRGVRNK